LPWRDEIIDGLLGADLVGFHLPHDAVNFQRLTFVRRKHAITRGQINTPGHYGEVAVPIGDNEFRSVRVGAFPISIDSPRFNATARQQ
ncbi:trehalose-6-phosphate synthase, partial [Klebsiella pneumoniae]|nr:trehalose-6-phosphate synthase [Klebsiella pneumoniae]